MRIDELRLYTHDLERMRQFYTHTLELPLLDISRDHFTLRVGATTLIFEAISTVVSARYHFAFNIPEHLFSAAKRWLAARAPLLASADSQDEFHFVNWNAHAVYFADPAGSVGELIARHDLPSDHSGPFSGAHLLSVSEIGLAVDDVPAFAARLESEAGCPPYRGAPQEDFAAVGDAHGLFILARHERPWWPDSRVRALEVPLAVRFSQGGAAYRLEGPPYRVQPLP